MRGKALGWGVWILQMHVSPMDVLLAPDKAPEARICAEL